MAQLCGWRCVLVRVVAIASALVTATAASAASAADAKPVPPPAGRPPNVVFILADDLGWGDLSCHGNPDVRTANLDKLAGDGTDFHQFYSANPVCSPSRVAFMTGRFPARFAIHEAIAAPPANRQVGQPDWLDPAAPTLPRLLKAAGYATGHYGKWHLCGAAASDAPLPAAYGIDEHGVWTAPPTMRASDPKRAFDDAAAFVARHKDRPFYLTLWVKQTHAPQEPSDASMKAVAHLDERRRPYAAALLDLDAGVGKVLDALRAHGLDRDTLVVFSSDNGPEQMGTREAQKELRGGAGVYYSTGRTGGLRGQKRSLYEGGVRVPLLVRWPGRVPAGRVEKDAVVAAVDLLPTVCAAANVPLPAGYRGDGQDVLPVLLGGKATPRSAPLFWEWHGKDTPADCWPRWAVRDGDWKLLADDAGKRVELYRLSDDRAESNDVAKQNPAVATKLADALAAWRAALPKEPDPRCVSKVRAGAG